MKKFSPGQVVTVKTISKESFYLFKKYQARFSKVVCACSLKHGTLLIVDSQFDDGTVIAVTKKEPYVIAIGYSKDLDSVYEVDIEETQ